MKLRRFSILAGSLIAAAGAAVTAQLLLSATPPPGPLTAAGMRRSTVISAAPAKGDGPGLTVSPATRRPVLIRSDGSRVEIPPAPPDGAAPTGEPPSVIRADGSVAQIFQVTLEDGSLGTREKVTHKNGNDERVETTDWDAQGEIVSIGTSTSITGPDAGFVVTPGPPAGLPVLPVAFQETTPGRVVLSPDQVTGAERVQDQFIADSGSGSDNPSTPAYLNRWRQSQSIADQRLKAAIGAQAFARWQMEAYLREKEQQTGGATQAGAREGN